MSPFVVVSLAITVIAAGVAVVAGVHLWRTGRRLLGRFQDAVKGLRSLTDDLQAEAAVTALEADHLRRQVDRLQTERRARGRQRRRRRS